MVSRVVFPTFVKLLPSDSGHIRSSIEVTGNQYRRAHRECIYKYVIGRQRKDRTPLLAIGII